jgi:hypothetical protein
MYTFANSWLVRFPMGIPFWRTLLSLSLSLSLGRSAFRVAFYNLFKEIYHLLVRNSLFQNAEQDFVLNRCEESSHVAFKDKAGSCIISTFGAQHLRNDLDSFVRSFTHSARKRISNKRGLEYRIKCGEKSMMQNAIADTCFTNLSKLRIGDTKFDIPLMPVRAVFKRSLQSKDLFLKVFLKPHYIQLVPLAVFETIPRRKELLGRSDFIKQAPIFFHAI